jgi:predicted nucleic acid-binding protein
VTYLVDANILSEATKPEPQAKVVEWLRRHETEIAVDPIILGEIRFGIHLLPAGVRRRRLERWFTEGIERIHCLPWDASTGLRWAILLADLRASGQAMPIKDSLIAATALVHGLTIATRNTRDFTKARVRVVDPFANGQLQ